jgi:uncharacterized membrane protein YqjE
VADTGEVPRAGGLSDALFRLSGTVVALLQTRLELATVEFEEERERATELLVLVLCTILLALFALLFASLFVIAWFWESYRLWSIGGVTLFYAVLGVATLLRLQQRRRGKPPAFSATLAELSQDVSSLRRNP